MKRRPGGTTRSIPISARLQTTFHEETCPLDPFTPAELDLVAIRRHGGLARIPLPAGPIDADAAWARLHRDGFVGAGDPSDTGRIPEEVAAESAIDRSAVVLRGDYAIVSLLRGHPATVTDLRRSGSGGEGVARMYTGVAPDVFLEETPGADGVLTFRLARADRGGLDLIAWCGLAAPPDRGPAARPARASGRLDEERDHWDGWTDVRVARPDGDDVTVTELVIGSAPDGLWVSDAGARPVWTEPADLIGRLNQVTTPAPGTPSWLHPAEP